MDWRLVGALIFLALYGASFFSIAREVDFGPGGLHMASPEYDTAGTAARYFSAGRDGAVVVHFATGAIKTFPAVRALYWGWDFSHQYRLFTLPA